ncbi:hypothetical protein H0H93_015437 [Arthromyces matolae]|nr:hypothetical protein H0H93_015437 [Arthromyces matolae]
MATPPSMTILDITGTYSLNRQKSSKNLDDMLSLQGVSWLTRKAIAYGSPTLKITVVKDAEGVEQITMANPFLWYKLPDSEILTKSSFLPGGIAGPVDKPTLDWEEVRLVHDVFGAIAARMRRTTIDNLQFEGEEDKDNESLKTGWTDDTLEHGVIQFYVKSDTTKSGKVWTDNETWGIELDDGERRFTRHLKLTGPKGNIVYGKMVYDYLRNPAMYVK